MSTEAVILVVVAGVVVNLVLRRLLRAAERAGEDRPRATATALPDARLAATNEHAQELIAKWGVPGSPWHPPSTCTPLHASVEHILDAFEEINFDNYVFPFVRRLVDVYEFNKEFIVIGELGEGSQTLVRNSSVDPNVYVVHVEETNPYLPEPFARSVNEYLVMCEGLYLQCLEGE